ncbi:carboxypeptidase-like regulatory domain-containing protein [Ekhidna sp.]|uniref:carboxypeptidase-like regulatory domain-containing protein n=1 Tax=Ekhidna sp. TaxID=2608089 RepID=UPI003CCBC7C8
MRALITIIGAITFSFATAQTDITGLVSDASSYEALHGAHIVNLRTQKFTISDVSGKFTIPAQQGDTLQITYVGYEKKFIAITDGEPVMILLSQDSILLEEVQVSAFPEYRHFKQMIIDTQPVDSSLIVFGMDAIPMEYFTQEEVTEQDLQQPFFGPSIGIGFDLEPLTKRGKEKRKLKKILARKELEEIAYRKFNREWVAEQTKLKGDDLTDFISFCDFSIEYLAHTSLFEIHLRMMTLFEAYMNEQSDNKKERYTPGA